MNSSSDARRSAEFEKTPHRDTRGRHDAPVFFIRHEPASNDPALASDENRLDAGSKLQSPNAANGCAPMPSAWDIHRAARAYRAYTFADILAAVAERVGEALRHARTNWQRRRQSRSIRAALGALDDHTLRDLGLHRSEIDSLASEIAGNAGPDRLRSTLSASELYR
jgi:uncharacterized protein YjiS (DUF1127 family)